MNKSFYTETQMEIQALMEQKKYDEAKQKILNELSMPYIPAFFEEELKSYLKEIKAEEKDIKFLSAEDIIEGLSGNDAMQLQAINALNQMNCRQFIDEIQHYFNSKPHPNLQALLIDTLIDQQLMDEFTVFQNDVEITFMPRYVEKPSDTDGFIEAEKCFESWFGNDDPSFVELCRQYLIQETFLMLPLAYEEDEGLLLAISIVEAVSASLDDGASFASLKAKLDLPYKMKLPLKSNNN